VFCVLIEVLRLNGLAATGSILGQGGVPLIIAARVRRDLARIAGRTNALKSATGEGEVALAPNMPEVP
jgi:hypothetical protein